MWGTIRYYMLNVAVAPREGRVSRNMVIRTAAARVSVAPREGRVSRNLSLSNGINRDLGRAPRGACE